MGSFRKTIISKPWSQWRCTYNETENMHMSITNWMPVLPPDMWLSETLIDNQCNRKWGKFSWIMAEIAEIEEISHFDNLMARAMAEIDNVDVFNDLQDPIKRRLPSSNLTHLSSIHTVCGPRPARITAGCLLVLSLWAAFMLLIHMNKKIDNLSTSLESTNDKLKTMEEVNEDYRSQALQRLQNMGKMIHALKRRGRPHPGSESGTIPPLLPKMNFPPSSPKPLPSTSSTSPPIKSTTAEDDSWDGDWSSSDWWWSAHNMVLVESFYKKLKMSNRLQPDIRTEWKIRFSRIFRCILTKIWGLFPTRWIAESI